MALQLNHTCANLGAVPVTTSTYQARNQHQPAIYHQQPLGNPQQTSWAGSNQEHPPPKPIPQPVPVAIHNLPKLHPVTGPSKPLSSGAGKHGSKKQPYGRQSSREVTAWQPEEIVEVFQFPAGMSRDPDERKLWYSKPIISSPNPTLWVLIGIVTMRQF